MTKPEVIAMSVGRGRRPTLAHSSLLMHHCQPACREKEANPHCEIVSQIQALAAVMQSAALVEKVSTQGTKGSPIKTTTC